MRGLGQVVLCCLLKLCSDTEKEKLVVSLNSGGSYYLSRTCSYKTYSCCVLLLKLCMCLFTLLNRQNCCPFFTILNLQSATLSSSLFSFRKLVVSILVHFFSELCYLNALKKLLQDMDIDSDFIFHVSRIKYDIYVCFFSFLLFLIFCRRLEKLSRGHLITWWKLLRKQLLTLRMTRLWWSRAKWWAVLLRWDNPPKHSRSTMQYSIQ